MWGCFVVKFDNIFDRREVLAGVIGCEYYRFEQIFDGVSEEIL